MKIKNVTKKLSVLVSACVLTVSVGFNTNAETAEHECTFKGCNHTEIVFLDDVDKEKSQLIIDSIHGEGETRGIFCLFGHDLAKTSVQETIHRYYAQSPRCKRDTYDVTYCKRSSCSYSSTELVSSIRIACCS